MQRRHSWVFQNPVCVNPLDLLLSCLTQEGEILEKPRQTHKEMEAGGGEGGASSGYQQNRPSNKKVVQNLSK